MSDAAMEPMELELSPVHVVEGEAATRYKAAAGLLGLELEGDRFAVDRAGVCPELQAALAAAGPRGPGDAAVWILVSPEQRRAIHSSERFSFEAELLDSLLGEGSRLLEAATSTEALACTVRVEPAVPRGLEELSSVESARVELRTASGSTDRFVRLAELDRKLDRPENYTSREYLQSMVDLVAELGQTWGDLETVRMPRLVWEAGSFCAPALGSVYLIQGESQDLLVHPPPYHNPDLEQTYRGLARPMKLSSPHLMQELHDMAFVRFDLELLARRLEEIENEVLLSADIDPTALATAQRGPAVAAHRAAFPRVWRELSTLAPSARRHEQLDPDRIFQMSPEAQVKLAVPVREVPVVSRLLADLDHIDCPRFYAYNRVRFARHFATYPELRKRYAQERIRRDRAAAGPGRPPRQPPADVQDDPDAILFIDP